MTKSNLSYCIVALAIAGIIFVGGCIQDKEKVLPETKAPDQSNQTPQQSQPQPQPEALFWQYGGAAIGGNYADAEVIDIGAGKYRMYYSIEPEVPGNKLEIFSATSSDGITWNKEEGVRRQFATFPDVIRLPDGRFRMYFQNNGVIKSAISQNGLVWTDEDGIRITAGTEAGLNLDNAGASTTMMLDNGTYIMVYRGTINQKYSPEVPGQTTTFFFYAVSADGINFQKKGMALDSRNTEFQGWLDGPEWIKWSDGEIRLYFWSYKGIYRITYKDGSFSKEPIFDFTTASDPRIVFPENPPADPTLMMINGTWFMYYGQHTKGIYYATYK